MKKELIILSGLALCTLLVALNNPFKKQSKPATAYPSTYVDDGGRPATRYGSTYVDDGQPASVYGSTYIEEEEEEGTPASVYGSTYIEEDEGGQPASVYGSTYVDDEEDMQKKPAPVKKGRRGTKAQKTGSAYVD